MDCEKFESLLIDELYGELDEVTSAAVRRHAAGCARCGALLSGLRATRKVAALPVEEPSSDLEDRILSAVREQQKVLPLRARFAMGLSRAGAWAMRPQTAMAAVFLVVIGTSFVLVQSRNKMSAPGMAANAEGAPVAASAAPAMANASALALDTREAAFAHGVEEKKAERAAATATTSPADNIPAEAKDKGADGLLAKEQEVANAAPIGGTGGNRDGDLSRALTTTGAGGGGATTLAQPTQQAQGQGSAGRGNVDQLVAGRAEKARNGCTQAAIQYFESARAAGPNTPAGNDATLEAARCYRAMGNTALARARLSELVAKPAYATVAQNELDALTPAAVAHKSAAPARMAPAAAAPPPQTTQTVKTKTAADSY